MHKSPLEKVKFKKYLKKIRKVKKLLKFEDKAMGILQIAKSEKSNSAIVIRYSKVSEKQFKKYSFPTVITGAMGSWDCKWDIDYLLKFYKHEKFKVGTDDDGNSVYLGLKYYFYYCLVDPSGAVKDDSPLYIFDSGFGKRTLHHSSRTRKAATSKNFDPKSSQATCHLVDDYRVPKYFTRDYFSKTGARRPPFRWIVIGPARSGTGIHTDPLGTAAWNALVLGKKRWCLFPPSTPKSTIHSSDEAIAWFRNIYPKVKNDVEMVEIIQSPGEIVHVPSGWHHVVLNLEFSISITQNYVNSCNLEECYLHARNSRPKVMAKLKQKLSKGKRKRLDLLETVPRLKDDSDGQSSDESGSDSDLDVFCKCHNKRRRDS